MTPELQILIPVYNEGDKIRQVLDTLNHSVRTSAEILILYDSDDDNTLTALSAYSSRLPVRPVKNTGRGVHEAIAAAAQCEAGGVNVGVVDMSSIDEDLLVDLCRSGRVVCLAEQNNGYILQNLLKVVHRRCPEAATSALQRLVAINTLGSDGRPGYIHSATYEELTDAYGLTPAAIAGAVLRAVGAGEAK